MVSQRDEPATGFSGHRESTTADFARFDQGGTDVGAIPRSRNPHDDVTGPAQRFDLSCENAFEAEIVADRSENGAVGRKSDRSKPLSRALESPNQLRCEMLTVGSAAAIAAPEDAPSILDGLRRPRSLL